jgi:hypothetical protein
MPHVSWIDTHVLQDACKGATLHFSYTASGSTP